MSLLLPLLFAVATPEARAADLVVCESTQYCEQQTLDAALEAAASGDTIRLARGKTYELTATTIDKALTIRGDVGAGSEPAIIRRPASVAGDVTVWGVDVRLQEIDFHFEEGASGWTVFDGTLEVFRSRATGQTVAGAMFSSVLGNIDMRSSSWSDNTADTILAADGASTVVISNTSFTDNTGGSRYGGVITISGAPLTIHGSSFTGNSGGTGAIKIERAGTSGEGCVLTFKGTTITGNTGSRWAGGVQVGDSVAACTVDIDDATTISGNHFELEGGQDPSWPQCNGVPGCS